MRNAVSGLCSWLGKSSGLLRTHVKLLESRPTFALAVALQDCVRRGELSSLQLETIVYANQRFNGPLLPDGAHWDVGIACKET